MVSPGTRESVKLVSCMNWCLLERSALRKCLVMCIESRRTTTVTIVCLHLCTIVFIVCHHCVFVTFVFEWFLLPKAEIVRARDSVLHFMHTEMSSEVFPILRRRCSCDVMAMTKIRQGI